MVETGSFDRGAPISNSLREHGLLDENDDSQVPLVDMWQHPLNRARQESKDKERQVGHGQKKMEEYKMLVQDTAETKKQVDQLALEFKLTMDNLGEMEERVRYIEELHEEKENEHNEDMERLKASAIEAESETMRWQSKDIDVKFEIQKMQPEDEGLEEFKKETDYLEKKYAVLHRDLELQSEELIHLHSRNFELSKRLQELETELEKTPKGDSIPSQKKKSFEKVPNKERADFKDGSEESKHLGKPTETFATMSV